MAKPKIQWHPVFGRLLRHRVESHYELRTNLPVGDVPRQADIALLRRTGSGTPPFRGLWRHLTPVNVLEYKGPTDKPRKGHVPSLIEVGLGIHRWLNADNAKNGLPLTPYSEVSFWYLANRLRRGFLQAAADRLMGLDEFGRGVWKSAVLGRPLFLVSVADLPVDEDSLPLHVLGLESLEQQLAVGQFVAESAERLEAYGVEFAAYHPAAWKEVETMSKSKRRKFEVDVQSVVDFVGDHVGLDRLIEKLGKKEVIEQIGKKKVLEQMNVQDIWENLTPARRRELARFFRAESKS